MRIITRDLLSVVCVFFLSFQKFFFVEQLEKGYKKCRINYSKRCRVIHFNSCCQRSKLGKKREDSREIVHPRSGLEMSVALLLMKQNQRTMPFKILWDSEAGNHLSTTAVQFCNYKQLE